MNRQESALIQTAITVLSLGRRYLDAAGDSPARGGNHRRCQERAVERAVRELPPEDYIVLHLALRERFSLPEVAEITGCSALQARRLIVAAAATVAASLRRDVATATTMTRAGPWSCDVCGGRNAGARDSLRVFAGLDRVPAPRPPKWRLRGTTAIGWDASGG